MKTKIYSFLLASCAVAFASCESDIDNFMVDDTIGLLTSGEVDAQVLKGMSENYNLYAIKSGKGFQTADISVAVDEQVLLDFNADNGKDYKALPADCYSLKVAKLLFSKEDYQKPFVISWNLERLEAELAQNPDLVIPLRMSYNETGVQVDESRTTIVLKPYMITPYVSLNNSGLYTGIMPVTKDNDETDVYLGVKTNFISPVDINYTLSVDEQLVADYNTANKTDYKVLPAGAYRLNLDGWVLKKNSNSARFNFTFNKRALMPEGESIMFGDYILPITISKVSASGVDPEAATILYAIKFQPGQIDKDGWKVIDYNSCVKDDADTKLAANDGGVENLIDGTVDKFWWSLWSTPRALPYFFTIDMQKSYTIFSMSVENPVGINAFRGNAKAGYVEMSNDNENWVKIADWNAPKRTDRTIKFNVTPTEGRYLRFWITEAFTYDKNVPDGAQINIAELNFWGE